MRRRSGSLTWQNVFAAGLLLRSILIVPMAPSGPLGASDLLPIGLASVFGFHALLAAGVFVGNRAAIAFGILTGWAGFALAGVGGIVGLPMPWPLVLAGYNLALTVIGIRTWEQRVAPPQGHDRRARRSERCSK